MTCFFDSIVNKRNSNEDSYSKMELALNHEAKVCSLVVADGMGGLDAGKDYSSGAVKLWYRDLVRTLLSDEFSRNSLENQLEVLKEHTIRTYGRIGRTLYKKGLDNGIRGGTTLTTVIHFWNSLIIANCGDSPVYGIRDGRLVLLSEIQNVAGKLVREGKTKPGSLLYHQNKNRLLSYVGGREEVHPFLRVVDSREYEGILLGSDGAFGSLDEDEILWILGEAKEPGDVIPALFDAARAKGEEDNQTAILYYPGGTAGRFFVNVGSQESQEEEEEEGIPSDLFTDIEEEEDYGEASWEYVSIRTRQPFKRARNLIHLVASRIRRS